MCKQSSYSDARRSHSLGTQLTYRPRACSDAPFYEHPWGIPLWAFICPPSLAARLFPSPLLPRDARRVSRKTQHRPELRTALGKKRHRNTSAERITRCLWLCRWLVCFQTSSDARCIAAGLRARRPQRGRLYRSGRTRTPPARTCSCRAPDPSQSSRAVRWICSAPAGR